MHARAQMGHGLLCGTQNSGEVAQTLEDLTCPMCQALVAADVSLTGEVTSRRDQMAREQGPALAAALRKVTSELRPRLAGSSGIGNQPSAEAALEEAEALLKRLDASPTIR